VQLILASDTWDILWVGDAMRIGELVRSRLREIFEGCDAGELSNLMDKDFCKEAFGIAYPFCTRTSGVPNERYWKDIHNVNGESLRVCNDWYEKCREPFNRYLVSRGIMTLSEDSKDQISPQHGSNASARRGRSAEPMWPDWQLPSTEELLRLAKITTAYARFLHPDIVRRLVADNELHRGGWSERLRSHGINADLYLWENSACLFAGVRRYAGSTEIAQHRGRLEAGKPIEALVLDDNDYPKHIWSFVFNGHPFRKRGRSGYSLAHLVDHKVYKNRQTQELNDTGESEPPALFGLYTSVTNTVYLPNNLMRPTDFSPEIRGLIQRRAHALYGGFCNLLPPHRAFRTDATNLWALEEFEWAEPVGATDNLPAFLHFRETRMEALLRMEEAPSSQSDKCQSPCSSESGSDPGG